MPDTQRYISLRRQRVFRPTGIVVVEPGDTVHAEDYHPIELRRLQLFGWIGILPEKDVGPEPESEPSAPILPLEPVRLPKPQAATVKPKSSK